MTPERRDIPHWTRQERAEDLAWIQENLDVFDFASPAGLPGRYSKAIVGSRLYLYNA
jgi:hypothetical protein